jgi:hypothetical protein
LLESLTFVFREQLTASCLLRLESGEGDGKSGESGKSGKDANADRAKKLATGSGMGSGSGNNSTIGSLNDEGSCPVALTKNVVVDALATQLNLYQKELGDAAFARGFERLSRHYYDYPEMRESAELILEKILLRRRMAGDVNTMNRMVGDNANGFHNSNSGSSPDGVSALQQGTKQHGKKLITANAKAAARADEDDLATMTNIVTALRRYRWKNGAGGSANKSRGGSNRGDNNLLNFANQIRDRDLDGLKLSAGFMRKLRLMPSGNDVKMLIDDVEMRMEEHK